MVNRSHAELPMPTVHERLADWWRIDMFLVMSAMLDNVDRIVLLASGLSVVERTRNVADCDKGDSTA